MPVEQDDRHERLLFGEVCQVCSAGGDDDGGSTLALGPQLPLEVELVLRVRPQEDVDV